MLFFTRESRHGDEKGTERQLDGHGKLTKADSAIHIFNAFLELFGPKITSNRAIDWCLNCHIWGQKFFGHI